MAQTVDNLNMAQGNMGVGSMYMQVAQLVQGITGQQLQTTAPDANGPDEEKKDAQGLPQTDNTQATKARVRVASAAKPK